MSGDSSNTIDDPFARILARHEADIVKAKVDYLQVEESFYAHTDGVFYEDLDTTEKNAYTRRLNEFNKSQDVLLNKVNGARSRLNTTKSLMDVGSSTITSTLPDTNSNKIPIGLRGMMLVLFILARKRSLLETYSLRISRRKWNASYC